MQTRSSAAVLHFIPQICTVCVLPTTINLHEHFKRYSIPWSDSINKQSTTSGASRLVSPAICHEEAEISGQADH